MVLGPVLNWVDMDAQRKFDSSTVFRSGCAGWEESKRMPMTCRVCGHKKRLEIDRAPLEGQSFAGHSEANRDNCFVASAAQGGASDQVNGEGARGPGSRAG